LLYLPHLDLSLHPKKVSLAESLYERDNRSIILIYGQTTCGIDNDKSICLACLIALSNFNWILFSGSEYTSTPIESPTHIIAVASRTVNITRY
jgi:hypothetical protein